MNIPVTQATASAPPSQPLTDESFDFLADTAASEVVHGDQSLSAVGQPATAQAQAQAQAPAPADPMVEQMRAQLAALQVQNNALQAQAAQYQQYQQHQAAQYQAAQQTQAAPRAISLPAVSMTDIEAALTPEQRELFRDMGPLVNVLSRVQAERYGQAMAPLLAELDDLRNQTAGAVHGVEQQLSAHGVQAFNATLAAALPGMSSVTVTPAWRSYLNETVPMTGGRTVASVLMDAHGARDLPRISEVYHAFISRNAASAKPPGVQPAAGSAGIAPTQSVAAQAQQAQGGKVLVSEAKIDELTAKYQAGLISHAAYTRAMDQLSELALSGAAFQ